MSGLVRRVPAVEHAAYLELEFGIDYADWEIETRFESAMGNRTSGRIPRALQLYLAGMYPQRDFVLESY